MSVAFAEPAIDLLERSRERGGEKQFAVSMSYIDTTTTASTTTTI